MTHQASSTKHQAPNTCRVVAIGGGGGATQVLKAVASFATERTAIIAVTDTGRSTGLARAIGNIPAPGDLRATIAAFAADPLIAQLLQHRFSGAGVPQLEGMAFGNLLLAALGELTGDFADAVTRTAALAQTTVNVLPVSAANTQICAELADGTIVEGELNVRGLNKPPLKRLFLVDERRTTNDERQHNQEFIPHSQHPAYLPALDAIRAANLVVLGPGSLWTTLLATLLFDGIVDALRETRGQVVYVCNTTTQPGQTDGYTALDHVQRVIEAIGTGTLDAALINRSQPDPEALRHYAEEGLHLLQPGAEEISAISALGVTPLVSDLSETIGAKRVLWNKQDTVRHDLSALGAALRALCAM